MMDTTLGTLQHRTGRSRVGGWLASGLGTVALAVVLTGTVAAHPIDREGGKRFPVDIRQGADASKLLELKLATPAGYQILVFG